VVTVVTDEILEDPEVGAGEEETPLLPFASPSGFSLAVRDKRSLIFCERRFICFNSNFDVSRLKSRSCDTF
jgi:hypothetical protein